METSLRRFALEVSGLVSGLMSASSSGFRFFVSSPPRAARIARRRFSAGSSGELSGTSMTSGDRGGVVGIVGVGRKVSVAQFVDKQMRCAVPHVVSLTISSYIPRDQVQRTSGLHDQMDLLQSGNRHKMCMACDLQHY